MKRRALSSLLVTACLLALFPAASAGGAPTGVPQSSQKTAAALDSLWRTGAVDSFWVRLDRALGDARAAGDSSASLRFLAMRGTARARLSMAAQAEPDLRRAVALAARLGAGTVERSCLRFLGYVLQREGRGEEAVRTYERLLERARASGDRDQEAWALAGLAYEDWRTGRSLAAASGYTSARAIFQEQGDRSGDAFSTNGLGTTMQALGRYDDAIASYKRAAALAKSQQWEWLEGIALNNMAVVLYSLGDPGEAKAAFADALELQRRSGDLGEAALTAVNVSDCDVALGRFEDAAAEIARVSEECAQRGIVQIQPYLRNVTAEIRRSQGRPRAAAALFRENLASGLSLSARDRLDAFLGVSRCLADMDSLETAARELEGEAPWAAGLGDRSMKLDYEIELGGRLAETGRPVDALVHLEPAEREAAHLGLREPRIRALSWAADAARACGRSERALALCGDAVRVWEADRGLPLDPDWREIRGASIGRIATLRASLVLHGDSTNARAAFDSVQVFKARTLMERMRGPSPDTLPPFAPVTAEELQRRVLRPGELLLDFYVGREESFVFALTPFACRVERLPPEPALDEVLGRYIQALISGPPFEGSREELKRLLLGSLLEQVSTSRSLIIVPDGILHRVSFAALLYGAAGTGEDASLPEIQMVPSATILQQLRSAESAEGTWGEADAEHAAPLRILALYENAPGAALGERRDSTRASAPPAGPPLSGAGGEVRDLSRLFCRVDLFAGKGGPVLPALRGYDVLHFATHTTIDEEHPWRSAIELGEAGGRRLSVSGADLSRAHLDARLAVLSACRSADGRLLSGEGVQSLAGAFLVSGVPTVVATLWPVDDAGTRILMRRLYSGLARGESVAAALRSAQVALRGSSRTRDPFHWSAFVVIGDGSLKVPVRRRPLAVDPPRVLMLSGMVVLLGWITYRIRKSRRKPERSGVISRPESRYP